MYILTFKKLLKCSFPFIHFFSSRVSGGTGFRDWNTGLESSRALSSLLRMLLLQPGIPPGSLSSPLLYIRPPVLSSNVPSSVTPSLTSLTTSAYPVTGSCIPQLSSLLMPPFQFIDHMYYYSPSLECELQTENISVCLVLCCVSRSSYIVAEHTC